MGIGPANKEPATKIPASERQILVKDVPIAAEFGDSLGHRQFEKTPFGEGKPSKINPAGWGLLRGS
jgi:hypothetical protein